MVIEAQLQQLYASSQWSNVMRDLVQSDVDEVISGCHDMTGLCPFMIDDISNNSDLYSIYSIMKMKLE